MTIVLAVIAVISSSLISSIIGEILFKNVTQTITKINTIDRTLIIKYNTLFFDLFIFLYMTFSDKVYKKTQVVVKQPAFL